MTIVIPPIHSDKLGRDRECAPHKEKDVGHDEGVRPLFTLITEGLEVAVEFWGFQNRKVVLEEVP